MQIVEIRNEWDRPITIPHNGTIFTIPVGGAKIVPYDAAASLFGNPLARDEGKVKGRRELYDHIRGLWNFYLGFDTEDTWEQQKRPRFSAVDVNTQEEIFFVIQDPDGAKTFNLTPAIDTTDSALIAATLANLQAQVAQLNARLMAQADAHGVAVSPVVEAHNELPDVGMEPVGQELPVLPAQDDKPVVEDGPRTPPTSSR